MTDRLREFLGNDLLLLWSDGNKLLESVAQGEYTDYSFMVFPCAKVYEGFLKKLFLEIGAIKDYQYNNDRWRVGRALNPQLEKEFRHSESVYDRIVDRAGIDLADELWRVWKKGRNEIFHFWPGRSRSLTLDDARLIVREIETAMERAVEICT